ncbi:MAG: hypothetical protein M1482_04765 [Chloroflexi bacterium]|nr:hypothetical protein [Chloroflexota bacterium]
MKRNWTLAGAALGSLAFGVAIGLLITWVLLPVQFVNADPSDLRQSSKDDYVRMVSAAYMLDGDLPAARLRLHELDGPDATRSLDDLIARARAKPDGKTDMDTLTLLAAALSGNAASLGRADTVGAFGTPQTIVVVTTPTAPVPSFALIQHTQLDCQDLPDSALLTITVLDASGRELPNIPVQVHGDGGDDVIYTGLKPERGVGYADYEAAPGTFSVTLLNAQSDTVSDLVVGNPPADCNADRGATPRGWKLVFQQK